MSEDRAASNNQGQPAAPEQPEPLVGSVTGLRQRTLRALSPWVQRRLAGAGPRPKGSSGRGEQRPASLTFSHTTSLLRRVQNVAERTRVWKPGVGSLEPAVVQRFARGVSERNRTLSLVGVRPQARPVDDDWSDPVEMTLSAGLAPSGVASQASSETSITGPSVFSVGQRIPSMDSTPAFGSHEPQRAPRAQAEPQVQRKPVARNARLFSRVEYVKPGAPVSPVPEPPPEPAPEQAAPPSTEQPSDPPVSTSQEGPPPSVQRTPDRSAAQPTPEVAPEAPARPEAGQIETKASDDRTVQRRQQPPAPSQPQPPAQPAAVQPDPDRPTLQRSEAPLGPPPIEPAPAPESQLEQGLEITEDLPVQPESGPDMPLRRAPQAASVPEVDTGETAAPDQTSKPAIQPETEAPKPVEIPPKAGVRSEPGPEPLQRQAEPQAPADDDSAQPLGPAPEEPFPLVTKAPVPPVADSPEEPIQRVPSDQPPAEIDKGKPDLAQEPSPSQGQPTPESGPSMPAPPAEQAGPPRVDRRTQPAARPGLDSTGEVETPRAVPVEAPTGAPAELPLVQRQPETVVPGDESGELEQPEALPGAEQPAPAEFGAMPETEPSLADGDLPPDPTAPPAALEPGETPPAPLAGPPGSEEPVEPSVPGEPLAQVQDQEDPGAPPGTGLEETLPPGVPSGELGGEPTGDTTQDLPSPALPGEEADLDLQRQALDMPLRAPAPGKPDREPETKAGASQSPEPFAGTDASQVQRAASVQPEVAPDAAQTADTDLPLDRATPGIHDLPGDESQGSRVQRSPDREPGPGKAGTRPPAGRTEQPELTLRTPVPGPASSSAEGRAPSSTKEPAPSSTEGPAAGVPPEPGRSGPAPIQRKELADGPVAEPQARAAGVEPEGAVPPSILGRDILARASSRAHSTLTRKAADRGFGTPADMAKTVQRSPGTPSSGSRDVFEPGSAAHAAAPALYLRTSERQVGPDPALRVLDPRSSQIQRQAAGVFLAQPGPGAWPVPDMALAAVRSSQAGGSRPRSVPQTRPAQPVQRQTPPTSQPGEVRVQRAPDEAAWDQEWPAEPEPMPLVQQPAPTPAQEVQPEVSVPEISPVDGDSIVQGALIQRAAEDDDDDSVENIDLADLAQRLLPIVKRMLFIERERRPLR